MTTDAVTVLDTEALLPSGLLLLNVHPAAQCAGRACVIHHPTGHHMRGWDLHWRDDRGIFERLCPTHGVGHPDPDQFEYWRSRGLTAMGVHGCCGCCVP